MTETILIETYTDIDKAFREIDLFASKELSLNKKVFVQYTTENRMTSKQRGALHVWCDLVAKCLNDSGLELEYTGPIKSLQISVPWSMYTVKDLLYKPVLKAMTEKTSTEEQSTIDPSSVAEAIHRAFAMSKGIALPDWPSNL